MSPSHRARVRRAVAGLAVAGVLASCTAPATAPAPLSSATSSPGEAGQGGEVAAADGLRPPQDAGPVPSSTASGPGSPDTWPASVLTGAGQVTSLTPLLRAEGVGGGKRLQFEVYDVSAGGEPGESEPVAAGEDESEWEVSPPLTDGRQYAWRVSANGTDWKGPWNFDVDTVRPGLAPRDDMSGISTHLITGVPAVTWMSRSFSTVASSAFATLEFQPGRIADPGLPPGWRMSSPLTSRWTTLTASSGESQPRTVFVADARDRSMTFRLTEAGLYVQSWSAGRPVSTANQATLTSSGPGRFELTEVDGTVTSFRDGRPTAVSANGLPRGTSSWGPDGLLQSVADPSGRTIAFAYGGGDCPAWQGFEPAPKGMLCRIAWWDGTRTEIGYVKAGSSGEQVGLIVDAVTADFAGTSLGIGWDAAGRVSALRSALVGAAAAASKDLAGRDDLLTQVIYDDRGRVAAVAGPAPQPGGVRLAHVYEYPLVGASEVEKAQEVVAVVAAGTLTGSLRSVSDVAPVRSELPASADYRMIVRSGDWTPVAREDRDGSRISLDWDDKTRRLRSITDYEGRQTTFTYDDDGRRSGSQGPATQADLAYVSASTFDEMPDGTAMKGLQATYWATEDFSGEATTQGWVRPETGSMASYNWEDPPLPASAWSARLTGTWVIEEGGKWNLRPTVSADAGIKVYVDHRLCEVEADSLCALDLKKGRHQLRIDISVPLGGGVSFLVEAGPDGQEVDDIESLYPAFNAKTSVESNDIVKGIDRPVVVTEYAEPWTGNPTSQTAPGGLTTTATYEPANGPSDQWGRKLTGTTPGGRTTSTAYWPVKGAVEASPCPQSAPAEQAGLLRTITRTDGVQVSTWYDAAGRPTAILTGSSADGELACQTYAPDGTLVASQILARGTAVESSTVTIAAGGDPRVTVTTIQMTGSVVTGEQTARVETDLLGRTLSYTDISGVVTQYRYDVFDRPTGRTITGPQGQVLAKVVTEYDDRTGRVTGVSVDGEQVAAVDYDSDGRVQAVSYGGGVRQRWSYGANGAVTSTSVVTGDRRTVSDEVRTNDAGRMLARTTRVEGEGATEREWRYGYDDALRLSEATLTVAGSTAGVDARDVSFEYGFGAPAEDCDQAYAAPGRDLNRTSGSRNGTRYSTCYDGGGRPVTTTDPLVSGGGKATLSWDSLGRLTAITADTARMAVEWRWGGLPRRVVDGGVSSDLDHVQGRLVAQRSTSSDDTAVTDSGPVEWRMAYSSPAATAPSVLLSEDGAEVRVLLPGGALWRKGAEVTIDHPGIRGEFLVRTGAKGAVVPGAGGGVLAEALGPFGEPLASGSQPGDGEYGYAFAQLQPTLPGPSGLVLKTARPYLPALGAFIAFDTQPGSSSTGYGYAEADPLNRSDPDGAYSWWDFGRDILAITSITVSLALPGMQWYTVLAVSVLASSAQLSITAMERFANGQELTTTDYVFEGISVGMDMLLLGVGEAASAASRKLSKAAKDVGKTLDDIDVKPGLKPSNADQGAAQADRPWGASIVKAAAMVFGLRAITGGFGSGEPPGLDAGGQGASPDGGDCPFEGGCAGIPDRQDKPVPAL